ncbi:MAG: PIG-L family deacetylase [Gemmatimonadales bacterium]|nr:PIG-L family deacetylase [Gemmatimonadales bacterium]
MIHPHPGAPRPRTVVAALLLVLGSTVPLASQGVGAGTGGAIHLAQQARFLDDGRKVLMIGAHPDDEDTELITILSRGMGIETAYLSLTRGEGGQNLIGSELGPALGLVRTEELLASRRIDGATQFFTRAYDFGFSKTATEAFRFWPRDSLLKDIVRIIRRFQPQVIVSVWTGTPRDGHGHHQASGILAREAFDAAQDSTRFRELWTEEGLAPWRPLKFYRNRGAEGPGQTLDGGLLDPAVGQSYHQIAATARSQHRSQDQGGLEEPGPSTRRIVLEAVAAGLDVQADTALFAGVAAVASRDSARRAELALAGAGVIVDAYTDDAEVVPGQEMSVTLVGWFPGPAADSNRQMSVSTDTDLGERFVAQRAGGCSNPQTAVLLRAGRLFRCAVSITVAPDARPSQPYFLARSLDGALYQWPQSESLGLPFAQPAAATFVVTPLGATQIGPLVRRPIVARSVDQAIGEVRTPVVVVPKVMLSVSPGTILWPIGSGPRTVTVSVEHAARDTSTAIVRVLAPAGWSVGPAQQVDFSVEGERRTLTYTVTPPDDVAPGEVTLRAEAVVGRDTFRIGAERIRYPHITPRILFHPAEVRAVVTPITFPAQRRIGYLRGAADQIPEALAAAGQPVRLLTPEELDGPTLDSLDVMVIGPRAYELDPAVGRANPRLLAFAERGGTLIVQYQQYQYVQGGFAPYPITISRPHDRVTDEASPARWLPGSEALRVGPNRLTPADWDGWVQERGLYFAGTWDARWTPLLELQDPDEAPARGGLLSAPYGKGRVIYTGLSFFRELPAAVPGAWRLFANLLALGAP